MFAITAPGERCEVRITCCACRAAHARCPAASEASSFASLTGFPVSIEMSAVHSSTRSINNLLHANKTFLRPLKPSATHLSDAIRA